jgi:hypothetical protein
MCTLRDSESESLARSLALSGSLSGSLPHGHWQGDSESDPDSDRASWEIFEHCGQPEVNGPRTARSLISNLSSGWYYY